MLIYIPEPCRPFEDDRRRTLCNRVLREFDKPKSERNFKMIEADADGPNDWRAIYVKAVTLFNNGYIGHQST